MMIASRSAHLITVLVALLASPAAADIYGGYEFPLGTPSFVDRVVEFTAGAGTNNNNPLAAVGRPSERVGGSGAVSLGNQGALTVEFTDNLLIDQDAIEGGIDLVVFENGPSAGGVVESYRLEISKDNLTYIDLGEFVGQVVGVDIKPFVESGDAFRFVRITDLPPDNSLFPIAGADINAIGALGSILVPSPSAAALSLAALVGLVIGRRGPRR